MQTNANQGTLGQQTVKREPTAEELQEHIDRFRKQAYNARYRKDRLETLMQRKSAKKWDPAKKAKMVRRLVAANVTLEQADDAITGTTERLKQLNAKPSA